MKGKYLFDRAVAFFGLVCLSPVFLIVAILIKKRMPGGPVIYRQQRVGQYGRLFTVYKFRSMKVAGEGTTSIASTEEKDRKSVV